MNLVGMLRHVAEAIVLLKIRQILTGVLPLPVGRSSSCWLLLRQIERRLLLRFDTSGSERVETETEREV
jgi:hypothetical protein